MLALVSAVLFQAPGLLGREKELTDFDAFHIAGLMVDRGQAKETYRAADTLAAQEAITGTRGFMPWTYPPPYLPLVHGFAQMPIGIAYLMFVIASFALYLLVLRRIAGAYLPGVLAAMLPTIVLTVRTGQNGFLTAGLIGWFMLAFMHGRSIAGVPLGLMVIKPHLAVGVALLALLGRRWAAMAIAAGIVTATLVATTAAFGPSIWTAFFGGVREAGDFLAAAYYQMYRMSSVYATVRVATGSASLALAFQVAGALAGIGLLAWAWRHRWAPRALAAAACIATLLVSPYSYDYDLTILGLAIAFVLPDIVARAGRVELIGLLVLSWAATGYGNAANAFRESMSTGLATVTASESTELLPLTAPFLLLLVAAALVVLRRDGPDKPQTEQAPTCELELPAR